MMKMLWAIGCMAAFAAIATVAGIAMMQDHLATPHTVAWFMAHDQELAATRAACINNPGLAQGSPDCVNATAAYWRKSVDAFAAEGAKH